MDQTQLIINYVLKVALIFHFQVCFNKPKFKFWKNSNWTIIQYLEFFRIMVWFDGTILIKKSISELFMLIYYFGHSMQPTLVVITLLLTPYKYQQRM